MKNANTFPSTERYFAAKIIEYGNSHLVKDACLLIQHPCMPHILSNKINCALLKIVITFEPAAIPASKFPEIFSTPVQMILNQFHVNFGKQSRSPHILSVFKFCTATLTKHHDQTLLFREGFLSICDNRKACFIFSFRTVYNLGRHAASVRWRLSSGHWDVRAWHFTQQSCSSFQFSQGYWGPSQ